MRVPEKDKPRYRTRKNEIATNVLGVCSLELQFIYVLPGWEGSAHDGRVLRDAITRRNGLKVPNGNTLNHNWFIELDKILKSYIMNIIFCFIKCR